MNLRFLGVRSVLPARPAPAAVDLDLSGRVALIGGSGEGKSLLCRLALGLAPRAPVTWEGEIALDGAAVDLSALAGARGRIGWMPQGGRESLVPGWSLDRHIARLAPDTAEDVHRFMEQLGLAPSPDVLGGGATTLSEGMIRRFLLALALSRAPELLVLDEPTAGLDPRARDAVIEVVSNHGGALLFATHDLALAEALAQSFVLVRDGAPVACVDALTPDGPLGHLVRAAASLAS